MKPPSLTTQFPRDSVPEAVAPFSPYLARLAARHPELVEEWKRSDANSTFPGILRDLPDAVQSADLAGFMQNLRNMKARVALLTALADLSGEWPLETVTRHLSDFADACLCASVDFLLTRAELAGEVELPNRDAPSVGSGVIVLGMGKLGAYELNYSSDIDLIIFFEKGKLPYKGRAGEQKFMNKLAQDLVQIMQERTPAGYVFRTDLRLRPDPASTPPAITVDAALAYYESVGQNWERAAMIKARAVAGDIAAGETFLTSIEPFIWRRNLDFASIQDIQSIKRQMDTRSGRDIAVPGHNIKIGLGGIREIEFFVQIHQLIWGGRLPYLRSRNTCDMLMALVAAERVPPEQAETLTRAYIYLRTLEHRLQMVDDQQTHTVPQDAEALASIAGFMGYATTEAFSMDLTAQLFGVHAIFSSSFRTGGELGGEGNLVFTGVTHDPDTLATIGRMGFKNPTVVSETVMGWHHGSRRCTRTKRARELLTELMPHILKRLAETANPDEAFLKFDEFLGRIPAGVQLFSLFIAHPPLLAIIADVMGSAPVLAETLSRHPDLLDSVLYGSFYGPLPDRAQLASELTGMLAYARDYEERMETLRRFKNEKQFQAGIQLLKGMVDARASGLALSALGDVILQSTIDIVTQEFAATYGSIASSRFAVLALGRLGSEEMAFGSDLDLVFIYDVDDFAAQSDGEKSHSASVYFNRFAQRILNALTTMGKEGRLYEVDTRLRPFGNQGLSAISIKAFSAYFNEQAWTFEFMALTRARAVAGDAALCAEIAAFNAEAIARARDEEKLRQDVIDMRARVAKEFAGDVWDLKYARGGTMDVDFICQYLLLRHAHAYPALTGGGSEHVLKCLFEAGLLPMSTAQALLMAQHFLRQLLNLMRLTIGSGEFDAARAMPGLRTLLAASVGAPDFETLQKELTTVENVVYEHYTSLLGPY